MQYGDIIDLTIAIDWTLDKAVLFSNLIFLKF
jgi:hypothetical protein